MPKMLDRFNRDVWVAPEHIVAAYASDAVTEDDNTPLVVLRTSGDLQIIVRGELDNIVRLLRENDKRLH